ncbi:sugar ABC transporter permease [Schaalia sp. ZJ405]|uniref:ABC transporter permease n=1 Tax=unclassified Schaalia TaxID=2691889 RepID=UPI0013EBB175|nr:MULTISPECIES: sugar ABC transporter permease [unclassified Schaalia]QPK80766.1 sugar ABC transporter permease [Schaalia sp. ZJ405]
MSSATQKNGGFNAWLTRDLNKLPSYVAILVLLILFVVGQLAYGKFFRLNTISTLFNDNAYLIILAVAMTVPILIGGIDLSVGAVIALSSVVGCTLANAGVPWFIVVVVMILIGTVMGAISGVLVRYFDMQPFIATLATMYLGQGIAAMISSKPIVLDKDNNLRMLGSTFKLIDGPKRNDLEVSVGLLIAVVVVLVAYFIMHRTRTGRTIYAMGAPGKDSARLMGLPAGRSLTAIFLISGTFSGIASVVYVAAVGKGQNILGQGWELNAIAAAVIGGTIITGGAGYILGSIVGTLVFATTALIITRDGRIPPAATTIITGLMLLLFVVIQRLIIFFAEMRRAKGGHQASAQEPEKA